MTCPASMDCWRYAYSKYYLYVGYQEPPTREELFYAGYAGPHILPKGGIWADSIPVPGVRGGICPDLRGLSRNDCPEYGKWLRKKEAAAERERRKKNSRPREWIPKETRKRVAQKARYKCVYCGAAQNSIRDGKKVRGCVDHYIPLKLGGTSEESNLVFACFSCNSKKGDDVWKIGCKM